MKKLISGLDKFRHTYVPTHQQLLAQLSHGQKPRVLFITCSDSRIDPNLITQTDVGELFVIRNAGNIIPPYGAANGGEGGTIEYAIHALGIEQIVVCGHSHCGAMKGLLKLNELQAEMPLVYDWLKHAESTRRLVKENYSNYQGEELMEIMVAENVLIQINNLKTYPVVQAKLHQGKLQIYGWIYHIETGEVLAYDPETHTYVSPQSQLPDYRNKSLFPNNKFQSTNAPPVACELLKSKKQSSQSNGDGWLNLQSIEQIREELEGLLANTPRSSTDAAQAMRSLEELFNEARQSGMSSNELRGFHYRFSEPIQVWARKIHSR
ncbi:Carbonate dehydratase [Stanieria cyanosphaera PCC 7437]|uniref:Carbonic anhydrase n=1 Tax=Stanieria cyanosphaera (strain ATCC 29371 / PCC 7437) TaxID=111780 RepID=K9XPR7_STAC7|nr:carbonic anhydrase [Stanieria cyanosphaera]AFZ34074.1 Carbonate dehydratase [Stanieria cyanosphaera PCC 7437]